MNERDGLFEKLEDLLGGKGFPRPRLRPPRRRTSPDLALLARNCRRCGRTVMVSADPKTARCDHCGAEV